MHIPDVSDESPVIPLTGTPRNFKPGLLRNTGAPEKPPMAEILINQTEYNISLRIDKRLLQEVENMLRAISTKDTGYNSNYIDISNHERKVKHSVVLNDNNKEELENEIVEELYRIFKHKLK